jgi:hypothetical protein
LRRVSICGCQSGTHRGNEHGETRRWRQNECADSTDGSDISLAHAVRGGCGSSIGCATERGGSEWGCRAARNGRGRAVTALSCVVGAESTVCIESCARTIGGCGTDRRGPQVSGRERVNEQGTLTGRTYWTKREKGKRARTSEGIGTDRRDPRAEGERGQHARESGVAGADRVGSFGSGRARARAWVG